MSCRGSGVVEATKTVEVVIPGGWSEIFMLLSILVLKHVNYAMKLVARFHSHCCVPFSEELCGLDAIPI